MKQRKDKLKNKAKIIKEVLMNPLATDREIADTVGVGKSTANRIKKELGQDGTKDDRILGIADTDLENVVLAQNELQRRLQEEPKKLKTSDIFGISAEATKRYLLIRGDATDKNGALKPLLTQEQYDMIQERLKIDKE